MNCAICGDKVEEDEVEAHKQDLASMADEEAGVVLRVLETKAKGRGGPVCLSCFTDAKDEGAGRLGLEAMDAAASDFETREEAAYDRERDARRHARD